MTIPPVSPTHLTVAAGLVVAAASLWTELAFFAVFKAVFILIAPGVMIMRMSRLPLSHLEFCSLALVMGLTLNAAVATAMIYANAWSPPLMYGLLHLATAALLILDLYLGATRSPVLEKQH